MWMAGASIVSVSVVALLAGSGSVAPAGAATVAKLVSEPVADGSIWPTAVKVAVPPGSKVTKGWVLATPLAAPTLGTAEAMAVQLTEVMAAGKMSVTGAATAVLGPLLLTTMWLLSGVAVTALVTPSVLVTCRSSVVIVAAAAAAIYPLSLHDALPISATVAKLVSEPVADGSIWPTAVKVAVPPGSKV